MLLGSLTEPLCLQERVQSMQAHNDMVLRVLMVCCLTPPSPKEYYGFDGNASTKQATLWLLLVCRFDVDIGACSNEGGTLPLGST